MLAPARGRVKGIVDNQQSLSIITGQAGPHGPGAGVNVTGLPTTDCLLVAVTTPVTAYYRPDSALLAARCKTLLAACADGVTLFGTTGEGAEFAVEDRQAALEWLIAAGLDPARIIVSIGALSIPDIVRLARHALDRDVAGLLLMPPCVYRGGITEDGTFRFYSAVIDQAERPEMRLHLYHFPDISGVPVTPVVIRRLEERYPGAIAGVMDSGGRGTICGLGNVMPRLMRGLFDARTPFERRRLVPFLIAGDNILSRFPFIASVKALIADATSEPAWRRVLPPMAGLPLLEEGRMIADFRRWEESLPPPLRSLYPAQEEQESRIVALRRG